MCEAFGRGARHPRERGGLPENYVAVQGAGDQARVAPCSSRQRLVSCGAALGLPPPSLSVSLSSCLRMCVCLCLCVLVRAPVSLAYIQQSCARVHINAQSHTHGGGGAGDPLVTATQAHQPERCHRRGRVRTGPAGQDPGRHGALELVQEHHGCEVVLGAVGVGGAALRDVVPSPLLPRSAAHAMPRASAFARPVTEPAPNCACCMCCVRVCVCACVRA